MDRKDATRTSADAARMTISRVASAVERAVAMGPSGAGRSGAQGAARAPPSQAPAPPGGLIMAAAPGAVNNRSRVRRAGRGGGVQSGAQHADRVLVTTRVHVGDRRRLRLGVGAKFLLILGVLVPAVVAVA